MNFFRKKKRQRINGSQDNQVINDLYKLLQSHGDAILLGELKLSLTAPVLILLNGLFEKLTEGINQPCFQVTKYSEDTGTLSFIFDFIQKVVSFKLLSGAILSDCPLLSLHCFKSLEVLEIHKVPITNVRNLALLRHQLKSFTCLRSVSSIEEMINQFARNKDELFQLRSLTRLDLSCNTIESLKDTTLRMLVSLERFNVSYNNIKCADSAVLPSLVRLNLGYNLLETVPILSNNVSHSLTHLTLRNNNLKSLKGLKSYYCLKALDVTANCIFDFKELGSLAYLEKLLTLYLRQNPICYNANYRVSVIRKLSPIKRRGTVSLDGVKLNHDEFYQLGQDVKPIPLTSYISSVTTSPGNLVTLQAKRLRSSVKSMPVQGKSRKTQPAEILDRTDGHFNASVDSTTSGISTMSIKSEGINKEVIANDTERKNGVDCTTKSGPVQRKIKQPVRRRHRRVSEMNGTLKYDSWSADTASSRASMKSFSLDSAEIDQGIGDADSRLSVATVEQSVIEVVAEDNVDNNDDEESDNADDEEGTFLVKMQSGDGADFCDIFLVLHRECLREKSESGALLNKLDLNYLAKAETDLESLSVSVTFDLLKPQWQYRKYVFELVEHLDVFMRIAQPFAVKNYQKKISDMNHCECLKCGARFLSQRAVHTIICSDCGSTMIIERNETDSEPPQHMFLSSSLPSKFCHSFDTKQSDTQSSVNSTNEHDQQITNLKSRHLTTQDSMYKEEFLKCDHRLKLFLSLNVYSENDEMFVCQINCDCITSGKCESFDCFLTVSSTAIYVFTILDKTSLSPGTSLKKIAAYPASKLKLVAPGYNYQSFIIEFTKPSLRMKFLTGDGERTFKLLSILEVDFLKKFPEQHHIMSHNVHNRTTANLRSQILKLQESLQEKAVRLQDTLCLFCTPQLLQTRKHHLRSYQKCFIGHEMVEFLCVHKEVDTRVQAVNLCEDLLRDNLISAVSKQPAFNDDNSWYIFNELNEDCLITSPVNDSLAGFMTVDNDVKVYLVARVKTAKPFEHRTLISTSSQLFLTKECHCWPLPRTFFPKMIVTPQYTIIDTHHITDVVSLEFYEDEACDVTVTFVNEGNTDWESQWMIRSQTATELNKFTTFIKTKWESLFAIDLTSITHPTCLL